jgi:hypothetical protein
VGLIERKVQSSKQLYNKLLKEESFQEEEFLRIIAHIINHSVITTTGATPFNLFRGRLFAPSWDEKLISPTEEEKLSKEEEELKLNGIIDRWCRINSQLYPKIRLRLEEIQNRKQKRRDQIREIQNYS